MEVEGYQKDQSHEALVATTMMDASREAAETVDLNWLAGQCGFRVKELSILMERWREEKIIDLPDGRTIEINDLNHLNKKMIWK